MFLPAVFCVLMRLVSPDACLPLKLAGAAQKYLYVMVRKPD